MTTDDTPRHSSARGVACTTAVLAGSFLTLVALVAIVAGAVLLWGDSQKDSAGYVSTSAHRFASGSYALATDRLDAQVDHPGGEVRLRKAVVSGSSCCRAASAGRKTAATLWASATARTPITSEVGLSQLERRSPSAFPPGLGRTRSRRSLSRARTA